jgi:hypothetical protein
VLSITSFIHYYNNGLGLVYNDARSHLDIGRRVVEGLKPGVAQLGSVWLPLTHFLMILTIWNDFMWHSGLAGALWSMISFVGTAVMIYLFLRELGAGLVARFMGVFIFAANINILYMQSTAMTELSLLFTMTTGAYFFLKWFKRDKLINLILAAFWIMLSTLIRYDGWFMLALATFLVIAYFWRKRGFRQMEGVFVIFCTLAGFGVFIWLLWNLAIFKDPLFFAFGPYSAHSQQQQFEAMGMLPTKHNWLLSTKIYLYALAFNTTPLLVGLGFLGAIWIWFDKKLKPGVRVASVVLMAPLLFNILALYLGHSILNLAGISGPTWFNVRYGLMMVPSFAIFTGWLIHRAKRARPVLIGCIIFIILFTFISADSVILDDATIGSSGNDVSEVGEWFRRNASSREGLILISAASHDSIIFSTGLQMKRFVHEGTGDYYQAAIKNPSEWVRWIVMQTDFNLDSTWQAMKDNPEFSRYRLVYDYDYADIYELKEEYISGLIRDEDIKYAFSDRNSKYNHVAQAKGGDTSSTSLLGKIKNIGSDLVIKEAAALYEINSWVELNSESVSYYDKLVAGYGGTEYGDKYKIAHFLQNGTPSTKDLSIQNRASLIEKFSEQNNILPRTLEDWESILKN